MVNFKRYSVVLITFITVIILSSSTLSKNCILKIIDSSGKTVRLNIELALSGNEKERGLMFRKKLAENSGMLFVFDKEIQLRFWMKNTYIPLDIAYIDKNGIINEIYHMKPLDVSVTYNSIKPAKYALEVNLGWFDKHNIKAGSKIVLNGCFGKQDRLIKR